MASINIYLMKAIVEGEHICDYIPQRPPIVMVDKFFGIDGASSASGLTVKADNMFCSNGQLLDGGIVEHIAQSGAMHIGFEHKSRGENIPLGFIGSINKLVINRLPNEGEELVTTITMEATVGAVTLIGAEVKVADETIAQCKMKVATQPQ